jgi:hypothetical protein
MVVRVDLRLWATERLLRPPSPAIARALLLAHTAIEMAFEIDHVGAVVHVITSRDEWSAEATLFAVSADGSRITATHASMGAGGPRRGIAAITKRYAGPPLPEDPDARRRVLDAYRVQRHDVEDAMNQLLGRDPEMHRPPRLSWDPLIELLAEHGKVVSEEELIAMPFLFEFSAEALAALEEG